MAVTGKGRFPIISSWAWRLDRTLSQQSSVLHKKVDRPVQTNAMFIDWWLGSIGSTSNLTLSRADNLVTPRSGYNAGI